MTCVSTAFSPSRKRPSAPERIADAVRAMQLHGGAHVVEDAHAGEQPDVLERAGDAEPGELMRLADRRWAGR